MKGRKTALAQRFLPTLNTAVGLCLYFCLMACNVGLVPVSEPAEVIGPEHLQQRYNPVTADQVVNFFSLEKIQENAKQQLDRVIRYARADGKKVMRRGDKNKNYQRLAVIFDRVMAASHLAGSQIEPIVIDRPQFQAKTYGGEAVIFYTGLTQALPDDELAFVVAHELAHIAAGHVGQLSSQQVINLKDPLDDRAQSDFFSYGNEQQADRIALVYIILSGFSAQKAIAIWERESQRPSSKKRGFFFSTHPSSKDRAKYLYSALKDYQDNIGAFEQKRHLYCNPLYCQKN